MVRRGSSKLWFSKGEATGNAGRQVPISTMTKTGMGQESSGNGCGGSHLRDGSPCANTWIRRHPSSILELENCAIHAVLGRKTICSWESSILQEECDIELGNSK